MLLTRRLAARSLRENARKCNPMQRCLSSGGLEDAYAQLRALEEFKQGEEREHRGEFQQALPLFGRVHEIFASGASGSANLAAASAYRLANAHRYLGQWKKASAVCQNFVSSTPSTELLFKTKLLNFAASCELLSGDGPQAVALATRAIKLAESQPANLTDMSVFVDCYNIRGISLFYTGSHLAVDDLQNSTRLSSDFLNQIRGLNNLGALHYQRSPDKASEIREAVGYWKEAIDGVTLGEEAEEFLADLPNNIRLAEVYATILCNHAAATFPTENARDKVEDVSAAMDLLGSALKTLEAHQQHPRVDPAIGRVLSFMAHGYHLLGHAVTAEGLFRSALDKFQSPYSAHDPRHLNDLAITLKMQAELLKMWEKREAEGARAAARADEIVSKLPRFHADRLLSSMFELPI